MKRGRKLIFGSKSTFVVLMAALVAAWFITGCQPRGETKTVREIVELSQERYAAVGSELTSLSPDVSSALGKVTSHLESLLGAVSKQEGAVDIRELGARPVEVATLLEQLLTRAGYTARPALDQLSQQYRMLGSTGEHAVSAATLELLVSRTYGTLASELESTKFRVEG